MNPDDLLNIDGVDDAVLLEDLKAMLVDAERNRPRSVQKALGPSEVGHQCMRKLAHATVASRKPVLNASERGLNTFNDPMAAMFGTGFHHVAEQAAKAANDRLARAEKEAFDREVANEILGAVEAENAALERIRWVPETNVTVRPGLSGTCDLYDCDTHSVLDWKTCGATRYKHYVAHGPTYSQRGQFHLYGRGYKNLGFPVKYVGGIFVSRTGTLRQIHLWREPYSDEFVDEILTRLDDVHRLIEELSLETNPAGFPLIPITPDDDCESTCRWWSPNPVGPYQCGGRNA